ncbi:MAG: hypothetical protein JSR65_00705 [Proteobacteria bacterium]|nr:hypothetical protein [Pseudomonadota bacterium]
MLELFKRVFGGADMHDGVRKGSLTWKSLLWSQVFVVGLFASLLPTVLLYDDPMQNMPLFITTIVFDVAWIVVFAVTYVRFYRRVIARSKVTAKA